MENSDLCDNEHLSTVTPDMHILYSNMVPLEYANCFINNDLEILVVGEATIEQYLVILYLLADCVAYVKYIHVLYRN